jgi:hypothetical protein
MRLSDKNTALSLRRLGHTYSEIADKLKPISRGTLSRWLREIELSQEHVERITKKSIEAGHHGRMLGAQKNKEKRLERLKLINSSALKEYETNKNDPLFLVGLVLYLAEGSRKHEHFDFMNSEPELIRIMIAWICRFGSRSKADLKFRLYIHKVYENERTEQFWINQLQINPEQMQRTIYKPTPHKVKKNPNYKGCIRIDVSGSDLYWRVIFWRNKVYNSLNHELLW